MAAIELNSVNSLINDPNLKAYYRFESGALTTDTSGEGHTLTAISDPAEDASGKFGGAVALDGDDAYSITDHADFKPTGNFTVGGWIKSSNLASHRFFSSWSQDTNMAGWWIGSNASGYLGFLSAKNTGTVDGTDYENVLDSVDINDGAWHFVVGTWDGSTLHLYKDGAEIGTGTAWANAPAYAATNYVRVGCICNAGTNSGFMTGSLDDMFLINGTALTADQIESIYDGTINSASPSSSPSASPSISPSASPSASPSISPSQSPSASISPSVSPSPSPGIVMTPRTKILTFKHKSSIHWVSPRTKL